MKEFVSRWLLRATSALAACLPLSSQAEPYFTNKVGNLIWDKSTGLVWMRCSLGQTWNGKTCDGEALRYGARDALAAIEAVNSSKHGGYDSWMAPKISQTASLIRCSNGLPSETMQDSSEGIEILHGCPTGHAKPTIDPVAFPQTPAYTFWASDFSNLRGSEKAVNFHDGFIRLSLYEDHLRLLQAQPVSYQVALSMTPFPIAAPTQSDWVKSNALVVEEEDMARRKKEDIEKKKEDIKKRKEEKIQREEVEKKKVASDERNARARIACLSKHTGQKYEHILRVSFLGGKDIEYQVEVLKVGKTHMKVNVTGLGEPKVEDVYCDKYP